MKLPIPFDNPATYKGHTGVDYGQRRGTIFRASGAGRVTRRTHNERAGNAVWVQYDQMPVGDEVGYCHLDNYTDSPPIGARFAAGDTLGRVGNTGLSTGPHLHSEVRNHATTAGYWRFFDPNRVVGHGSSAGGGAQPIPNPPTTTEEDADMRIFSDTNGSFYLALPGKGTIGIRNTSELKLLRRLINSKPGAEDRFNPAERDIIAHYMRG